MSSAGLEITDDPFPRTIVFNDSDYTGSPTSTNPATFYITVTDSVVDPGIGYGSSTIPELEIFLLVLFIGLTVVTIIGNSMALSIFARIPLKKTNATIFFMSMAIADLNNGIFMMPLSIYSLSNQERNLGGLASNPHFNRYCIFAGVVMNTSKWASLFTLIIICFDRFMAVYDALRKNFIMTTKNSFILVIICWFCALHIALFPYFIPDTNPEYQDNYQYFLETTQCDYAIVKVFDYSNIANSDNEAVSYDWRVIVSFIFLNILPIIIPTYLIIFFCSAVILILKNIFKNTKRIRQQIDPTPRRERSFRNVLPVRNISFKRKEKPVTTQLDKVDAGYSEIHVATGTASDDLEGKVVYRRQSRRMTRQNVVGSPRARDRWSQMSLKSLQKKTKADNQQKAIKTVVFMLAFFVFCYGLSWFNILYGLLYLLKAAPFLFKNQRPKVYWYTLASLMRYLNCAGNPFLYYFRMVQFKSEVDNIIASINGSQNRNNNSASTSRPSRPSSNVHDSSFRLSDNVERCFVNRIGSFKGTPTLRGSAKIRKNSFRNAPPPLHNPPANREILRVRSAQEILARRSDTDIDLRQASSLKR